VFDHRCVTRGDVATGCIARRCRYRYANLHELNLYDNSLAGTLPPQARPGGGAGRAGCVGSARDPSRLAPAARLTPRRAFRQLAKLSELRMVNVAANSLSGSLPPQYTNLSQLQVLYVQANRLDGALPEQIGGLGDLRFLNASDNNISGTLPYSLGELGDLQELTLFENSLTGDLPNELGKLAGLRSMMINDNKLNGNLTEFSALGELRKLTLLDLYNNEMFGELPASFQNLTSLRKVYVNDEHLKVVRQYYCRQRIPQVGKYNWIIVREMYPEMAAAYCEHMHDTLFAFNPLQVSGVYQG
jgi:Leucine-rich repeat (LRR) protein